MWYTCKAIILPLIWPFDAFSVSRMDQRGNNWTMGLTSRAMVLYATISCCLKAPPVTSWPSALSPVLPSPATTWSASWLLLTHYWTCILFLISCLSWCDWNQHAFQWSLTIMKPFPCICESGYSVAEPPTVTISLITSFLLKDWPMRYLCMCFR